MNEKCNLQYISLYLHWHSQYSSPPCTGRTVVCKSAPCSTSFLKVKVKTCTQLKNRQEQSSSPQASLEVNRMEDIHRRIVLLGKTGTGKSSLANTIFGTKDLFKVSHGSNSATQVCESNIKNIDGKIIQLIDTPGLFDTDPKSTELSPELLKCVTECAPGPHAFLIVLKVERFTRQEQAVVDIILKYFSEEALKYATMVFTHGQQLEEGMRIEDWLEESDALKNLVRKCGGRVHVFDNKYWNNSQDPYRNNQHQVRELLKTIEQTVEKNGGNHYSNEFLQMAGKEIQQEVKQFQASCPEITFKDVLHKAKTVVYKKLMDNMQGALIGILVGGFLGACAGLMAGIAASPSLLLHVSAVVAGTAIGGSVGGMIGSISNPQTPTEAVQNVTAFLGELEPLVRVLSPLRAVTSGPTPDLTMKKSN